MSTFKTLVLIRTRTSDEGTRGELYHRGVRVCSILELPWRDNRSNLSCIPTGIYNCEKRKSPKFGWTYWIKEVESRTWILQHAGNLAGDVKKGYKTHSAGCQLPCMRFGRINGQMAGLMSAQAIRAIDRVTNGRPFRLAIVWSDNNATRRFY